MGKGFWLITRFYARLLRLYPREYQAKFSSEQVEVFQQYAQDAARHGHGALLVLFLRELLHLPGILLRSHLHRVHLDPANRRAALEAGTALFAFTLSALPVDQSSFGVAPWLLVAVCALLVGLWRGLPRWSMPYVGVLISLAYYLLLAWFLDAFHGRPLADIYRWWQPISLWERLAYQAFTQVLFTLLQLAFVGIIVLSAGRVIVTKGKPVDRDWTMVSFLIYGMNILAILVSFDEYHYQHPYQILAAIFLVLGAWGYFKGGYPGQRVLALMSGTALAFFAVAVGKWIILPWQPWAGWSAAYPAAFERWTEALGMLTGLPLTAVSLLLPGFYWFPHEQRNTRTT